MATNRTIDDTNGDLITGFMPVYAPTSAWNPTNCTVCFVQPEGGQFFDYTKHDSTQVASVPSSVTLNFTGTAIYLFCVVPNTVPLTTTFVDLKFTLDGAPVGTYTHVPDSSSDILYQVPVLSTQNLNNTPHTLIAETAGNSLFIFDFAIYTFDDSPPKVSASGPGLSSSVSTQPTSTATVQISDQNRIPIAAIVVGSISAWSVVAIALVVVLCWRRRSRQPSPDSEIDAFTGIPLVSTFFRLTGGNKSQSATILLNPGAEDPILPPYALTDPFGTHVQTSAQKITL
ncbi:hypothetical protein FB45DRAFT_472363 [Roridomyces roridus]|uniref:Transmembrane protein n=1 Tax=Roridomyces roridus TaxID=1738132 RepID=A0AAD7BZ89_9AGAR|nr:hypothetical protein FB45DRAFT_472363 [Roridomyces roridus]